MPAMSGTRLVNLGIYGEYFYTAGFRTHIDNMNSVAECKFDLNKKAVEDPDR